MKRTKKKKNEESDKIRYGLLRKKKKRKTKQKRKYMFKRGEV